MSVDKTQIKCFSDYFPWILNTKENKDNNEIKKTKQKKQLTNLH